jgi:DNA-directed RNA polymerase subunit alpha
LGDRRYEIPIERLRLSVRAHNGLLRSGILTVGDVLDRSEEELMTIRNLGRKGYEEIRRRIVELALNEPPDEEALP